MEYSQLLLIGAAIIMIVAVIWFVVRKDQKKESKTTWVEYGSAGTGTSTSVQTSNRSRIIDRDDMHDGDDGIIDDLIMAGIVLADAMDDADGPAQEPENSSDDDYTSDLNPTSPSAVIMDNDIPPPAPQVESRSEYVPPVANDRASDSIGSSISESHSHSSSHDSGGYSSSDYSSSSSSYDSGSSSSSSDSGDCGGCD